MTLENSSLGGTFKNIAIGTGAIVFAKASGILDALVYLNPLSSTKPDIDEAALKELQAKTEKAAQEAETEFNELNQKAQEALANNTACEASKATAEKTFNKAKTALEQHPSNLEAQKKLYNEISANCKNEAEEAAKKACQANASAASKELAILEDLTTKVTKAKKSFDTLAIECSEKAKLATDANSLATSAKTLMDKKVSAATEAAAKDSTLTKVKEAGSNTLKGLKNRVTKTAENSQGWFVENKAWLGETFGFIATYYAIDYFAAKKIENPFIRKSTAFTFAVAVVWTASNYGFGNNLPISTAVPRAALSIGAAFVTKHLVAPTVAWASSKGYHGSNWISGKQAEYTR